MGSSTEGSRPDNTPSLPAYSPEGGTVNGVNTFDLFAIPDGPPPSYSLPSGQALSKPFALSQLAKHATSPFARGWNAELSRFDVEQAKWLEFLDGLSFAISSSQPLYVLNLFGKATSWIPIVGAAGTALQSGARKGSAAASKSATDRYVTRANEAYFEPRGLKVQLMTGQALRNLLDLPPLDSARTASGSGSFANRLETVHKHIRIPIISGLAGGLLSVIKPVPQLNPAQSSTTGYSTLAALHQDFPSRNIASLQPCLAPIDFRVPASLLPNKLGDKFSKFMSGQELALAQANDLRARQSYSMLSIARGEMSASQWMEQNMGTSWVGGGAGGRGVVRGQGSAFEEARRVEQNYRRRGRDTELERTADRELRKDEEAVEKVFWLVLLPSNYGMVAEYESRSPVASTSRTSAPSHSGSVPSEKQR